MSNQGRAIVLKDGSKRADVIRDAYYKSNTGRSDIVKMLEEKYDHVVTYQIVFAATKTGTQGDPKTDPRVVDKEPADSKSKDTKGK